jgi:hypothetical protein
MRFDVFYALEAPLTKGYLGKIAYSVVSKQLCDSRGPG